jgi:hypothetical protein
MRSRMARKRVVRLDAWQCQRQFEPSGEPANKGSHICRLEKGHTGAHRCAVCLRIWNDGDADTREAEE